MAIGTALPEGITTMPPGPELGAALDRIDPATVHPAETAGLLLATRRQLSHLEARHAAALRECALADVDAPGGRSEDRGRHAATEPRIVLGESRTRIDKALDIADDAFTRLPALGAAWTAGDLDGDRVRVFSHWTRALSDRHATEVVEAVLPEALLHPGGGLTLSALIERISEVAVALDPTWAARMYDTAAAQARVRARRTRAGTVNLSGLDLPLDAATRSVAHIATLAARLKAAGHPGGIDTLRARVYLLLLAPRTHTFDDDALIAHLLATAPAGETGPRPDDPHVDSGDPADAPPDLAAPDPNRETGAGQRDPGQPDPGQRDPAPWSAAQPSGEGGADQAGATSSDKAGGDEASGDEASGDEASTAPGPRLPRQARIELRVALSTLMGLDQRPARMPGHGVLHAELARELAMSHSRGHWRIAIVDQAGELSASLLTRRRPSTYCAGPPVSDGTPAPIVELHVTEAELAALHPAAHPTWTAVLRDLQSQQRVWQHARAEDTAAREAEQEADHAAADLAPALDPAVLRRVAARRRARAREALLRFPTAALRRWIEQRDRACTFPPCGASATRCDIDHTIAVTTGGLTIPINLGPACSHDHDAKTTGGWTVHQPQPGRFTWTSPTGNHYTTRTPKIIPELPPPLPPELRDHSDPLPDEHADHGPLWHNNPHPGAPDERPDDQPPAAQPPDDQRADDPPF